MSLQLSPQDFAELLSTRHIRRQAQRMADLCQKGGTHFELHLEKLEAAAQLVLDLTKSAYPNLDVPFHSRRQHFLAGGVDRVVDFKSRFQKKSHHDRLQSEFDLIVVSVLLDAGAGPKWSYRGIEGHTYTRSEGLAVASYDMFVAGLFSSHPNDPLRIDADKLMTLTVADLEKGLQVSSTNPLTGLEGRTELLRRLGSHMKAHPEIFPHGRCGDMALALINKAGALGLIPAIEVLVTVLSSLDRVWPTRLEANGMNFGDVWRYEGLGTGPLDGLVPFHKLSQWLSYSLLEALIDFGIQIRDLSDLTGLPEYRNGGLFLDSGVLVPRDPAILTQSLTPDHPAIIEWRALTVWLLDRTAELVRKNLNMSADQMPLAKVLQGGTWTAGRQLAQEKRGGLPPLNITSDGTVF